MVCVGTVSIRNRGVFRCNRSHTRIDVPTKNGRVRVGLEIQGPPAVRCLPPNFAVCASRRKRNQDDQDDQDRRPDGRIFFRLTRLTCWSYENRIRLHTLLLLESMSSGLNASVRGPAIGEGVWTIWASTCEMI